MSGSARPRELRRRVVSPAQVRFGATWTNACVLNISSRGLLLYSAQPVTEGSYIELRHGRHLIIARVIWRSGARAGLSAEKRLPVEEMAIGAQAPPARLVGAERRTREHPGRPRTHDEARWRARALEFAGIAILGASLAAAAFALVERTFTAPLNLIRATLGG